MLIISYLSFMSTMNPLIEWKTLKGIPVEIVNVQDIGSNPTSIKDFITDYYYYCRLNF